VGQNEPSNAPNGGQNAGPGRPGRPGGRPAAGGGRRVPEPVPPFLNDFSTSQRTGPNPTGIALNTETPRHHPLYWHRDC
jgi:hypothetical protein